MLCCKNKVSYLLTYLIQYLQLILVLSMATLDR